MEKKNEEVEKKFSEKVMEFNLNDAKESLSNTKLWMGVAFIAGNLTGFLAGLALAHQALEESDDQNYLDSYNMDEAELITSKYEDISDK